MTLRLADVHISYDVSIEDISNEESTHSGFVDLIKFTFEDNDGQHEVPGWKWIDNEIATVKIDNIRDFTLFVNDSNIEPPEDWDNAYLWLNNLANAYTRS